MDLSNSSARPLSAALRHLTQLSSSLAQEPNIVNRDRHSIQAIINGDGQIGPGIGSISTFWGSSLAGVHLDTLRTYTVDS